MGSEPPDPPETPVDLVELPDGRRIVVLPGHPEDAEELHALYRRLSDGDRWLRFFSAAAPAPSFFEHWLSIAERGGLVLIAWLEEPSARRTLIGEAGYSLLAEGDGELGITVDPLWRGWLGSWLLAVLLREAAARDVPNLQAVVQLTNRPMLSLLRKHRAAVVEQAEPDEIRLVIATSGPVSTWPVHGDRPRILVEAAYGRWAGESAARAAGFDVRTCRGPGQHGDCPLLSGEGCPLADEADVVVMLLPDDDPSRRPLLDEHRRHPELQLVLPEQGFAGPDSCDDASTVVDRIRQSLGLA